MTPSQPDALESILRAVARGDLEPAEAARRIAAGGTADIGIARVDVDREQRRGRAEAIFCQGKTPEQAALITATMLDAGQNVLATRVEPDHADAIHAAVGDNGFTYHDAARLVTVVRRPPPRRAGIVPVICAGTSDLPVAEEAAITAEFYGNTVRRIRDVGVAGLQRILAARDDFATARVVVVVAGMEGALPSVVAGLSRGVVVAVPTSVGYGAHFGGLSALLGMVNSCAPGVAVVNIDNGFGAGYLADVINEGGPGAATPS